MNVLLSAYACNPSRGGESGNGFHWTWEMALQGHNVWCLTNTDDIKDLEPYLANHPDKATASRIKVTCVQVPAWVQFLYRWQFGVYLLYMVWQRNAWKTARQLDRTVNFDLVHHATYGSLQMGSWMWRLKKPMVFGPVGGGQRAPKAFRQYIPNWVKTETMRDIIGWFLMTADPNVRQTMRHASVVLTSNQETALLARRLGARQVELFLDTGLPESFYNEEFEPRPPRQEVRLLWLARLFPRKALPLVLDALSQVSPNVSFHLTVIGDGPLAAMVPTWIEHYGLTGRVTWQGEVAWPLIKGEMLAHDIFLFGSLRDSFASQFLEAMACGLPIITLDHQGARDFIPETAAIKVPVTNPTETTAALARAVEKMAQDPALRNTMGKAAFEFALTQTWPAKAQHFREVVATVLPSLPVTSSSLASEPVIIAAALMPLLF